MKRELFSNVLAIPYTSGAVVQRTGFLSAVIGTTADLGAEITVKVEHSDDGTTFVPATDTLVFPDCNTEGGEYTFNVPQPATEEAGTVATAADNAVNIDVDLVGLKDFVKFTVTGGGALAIVLGDSANQPV